MSSMSRRPMTPAGQNPEDSALAAVRSPTRIRRNIACVRCRDAKVKCNASSAPTQPCSRCAKLEVQCVVDKGHKRTSRRSKLEELAAEVRNIKEVVAPRTLSVVHTAPTLDVTQLPSPQSQAPSLRSETYIQPPRHPFVRLNPFIGAGVAVSHDDVASAPLMIARVDSHPTEARALGSRVFSGKDIDYYFDMYFTHFHPYFPIVRIRDPNTCYARGKILFWVILLTACRRFAHDDTTYSFLAEAVGTEIWTAVSEMPRIRPPVINALLLLATWPLPQIRFLLDSSLTFANMAMSACLMTGIHTGKANHDEFIGMLYVCEASDEEAIYTWAGCNIINHRICSYQGCPSTATLFNKALDDICSGSGSATLPRSFLVQLETSRFINGVSRIMSACLEESRGVPYHLVDLQEEEFAKLERHLSGDLTDLDRYVLICTLLEIQLFYITPLPGYNEDIFKRNLLKCYTTAGTMLSAAFTLQEEQSFLRYSPHFIYRQLLSATCVILLIDSFTDLHHEYLEGRDQLLQKALSCMRAYSVLESDLPLRVCSMLEKFWEYRHRIPRISIADWHASMFSHRLGACLAFDCLRRWKKTVEAVADVQYGPPPATVPRDDASGTQARQDLGGAEPLEKIDWNAFLDDFDWTFTQNDLAA